MSKVELDAKRLHRVLDNHREIYGLTWREIGRELDISSSTFTRLSQGNGINAGAFLSICYFLDMDAALFMGRGSREE